MRVPLFVCEEIDGEIYKTSSNGTIMNKFDVNYKKYMRTPVEEDIFKYLSDNTSNVQATLWGHGGVGKTAAVQFVCENIFHGNEAVNYKYVIFTTAKDRKFDPKSGEIVKLENLKSYSDIIQQMMLIIFEESVSDDPKTIIECEERLAKVEDKLLLVVDDYETYSDEDKQSIQEFVNQLDLNYHRVIITTRNIRLANGIPIQTNEFDENDTIKFFESIIENEYPKFQVQAREIIADAKNRKSIHDATEGRAISIHHFVSLLVQYGFSDTLLQELHNSENMSKFLYDRIYDLLSDDAKKVFCCISLLVNKESLFSVETLEYVVDGIINESFLDDSLEELIDQKVIEKTGTEFLYRVYATNIISEMTARYEKMDSGIKDLIEEKKKRLGGSFVVASIDSALLNAARKTKISGTYEEVKEKYIYVIKKKKADQQIKREAIKEYLEYVAVTRKDSRDILDYKKYVYLENDEEMEDVYIKSLWNIDEKGRKEAVEILLRQESTKVDQNNLPRIALKIWFCVIFYLDLYTKKKDISYRATLLALLGEGEKLKKYISNESFCLVKKMRR